MYIQAAIAETSLGTGEGAIGSNFEVTKRGPKKQQLMQTYLFLNNVHIKIYIFIVVGLLG